MFTYENCDNYSVMKNGRLVLLNTSILTSYGNFEFRPLTLIEARLLISGATNVESAIGHSSTAEMLSELLDFPVKTQRFEFYQEVDEAALIFKLKSRVDKGEVLSREDIESIGYEFGLLTRIK